ncbi:MAG: 3-hydroxyacyl-CoA dehydrogenase NAD-binding domain-containing protein, partial [Pseudomonadota bacterium]
MIKTAAIIGGGVIGGGWAARFLLNGIDVNLFDPDPEAERKINEVIANARRSLPALLDYSVPVEGKLRHVETLADAVKDADWIQESVPERLEIKHKVFAEIHSHARKDALIASSTSGFKPSELQQGAKNPNQIFVAHPFNPVYLLPVIELVGNGGATARATKILERIGMKPVTVKKEIDAHVADRLLEAVWREALWLIKDGICTTKELDDIMRFGFGLRWAQMGLFETYRIAGGEAGMKHFLEQFGPCLTWPWTKLMDVPEFNDELVELIAGQSDEQSGHLTIRELERKRDDNLVTILRGLKARNWG